MRKVGPAVNLTPLLDVLLVLLVIVLAMSPLVVRSLSVALPSTEASPEITNKETLYVQVTAKGDYLIKGQLVSYTVISSWAEIPETVVIEADKASRYEAVARVGALFQKKGTKYLKFSTL